ncbi:MAG: CapA family protein [Lachnospiraceae bacterium]|nr:CapA family protein [Lachnospiraceae bacterium]
MGTQLYGKKLRFTLTVALAAGALMTDALLTGCGESKAIPATETRSVTEADLAESSVPEPEEPAEQAVSDTEDKSDQRLEETTPSEPAAVTEPFSITLAFAGDINFDDSWCTMGYLHSQGDDLTNVIDPDYLAEMQSADLLWINNEFCYSDRGTPMAGKMYTFRSDPANVKYLTEMGVDLAGLANNHVFDYGEEAFLDTLQTLQNAGIPYVGAGINLEEASAPVFLDADGVTIAYVAASRAEKNIMTPEAGENSPGILRCYDMTRFLNSIKKAAEEADYVIALPHWGTEYSTTLEQAQIDGARACIDAGADAVIGTHTHCLQGVTSYHERPIAYSLGNFWFNERTLDTMLFEIRLSGIKTIEPDDTSSVIITDVDSVILPGRQSGYVTTMAKGAEKQEILDAIDAISPAAE